LGCFGVVFCCLLFRFLCLFSVCFCCFFRGFSFGFRGLFRAVFHPPKTAETPMNKGDTPFFLFITFFVLSPFFPLILRFVSLSKKLLQGSKKRGAKKNKIQ
jgi:hypothetical protein